MPDSKPVEAMGEVERLAYVRDGLRQLAATPENEWPVRNTLLSWLELQAATIDQALDSLRGVEIETDDEGYVFITITTDPSAAGHAVIVNGRNVDPGEPEGGAREALERIKPQAVKAMAVELSMDEPIHYVGHAFDRVVEIAVEALALSGGREQPEGDVEALEAATLEIMALLLEEQPDTAPDMGEPYLRAQRYAGAALTAAPAPREQPAGLREAAQRLLDARSDEAVIFAKAELRAALIASPDQESER